MAFGLSYMPNMGNTGAGWEKLGEVLGQAFQQHGQAKGMAGKYRSLIKAQMGKDEQAQQFSDDFLGSDGTYVVDPDHLGLGELQEVMDAMAARRTDDGRNMMQSVIGGINQAKADRKARLNAWSSPETTEGYKNLDERIIKLNEILRLNEDKDGSLAKEKEQLGQKIQAAKSGLTKSGPTSLDDPFDTIASASRIKEEAMEAELRLSEINGILNADGNEVRNELLGLATEQKRMIQTHEAQREALANQPLNIPDIVMSSMGNHPYASSGAIKEAMNLAGLMQQQQAATRTSSDREKLLGLQVEAAGEQIKGSKSARKFNEDTASNRAKAIKAGARSAKQKYEDLVNQAKANSKGLDQDRLTKIVDGDFSALSGLSSSEESRYLRAAQSHTNIKNRQIQDAFLKLKQNAKPGISGTILTNSRILAESASKAMDDLRKDIRMAKAVKSSNPEMAKNLGYDIPQMEKNLKKWEKDMEKYKGILDQALGEGSGNTFDTKTKTFR